MIRCLASLDVVTAALRIMSQVISTPSLSVKYEASAPIMIIAMNIGLTAYLTETDSMPAMCSATMPAANPASSAGWPSK